MCAKKAFFSVQHKHPHLEACSVAGMRKSGKTTRLLGQATWASICTVLTVLIHNSPQQLAHSTAPGFPAQCSGALSSPHSVCRELQAYSH